MIGAGSLPLPSQRPVTRLFLPFLAKPSLLLGVGLTTAALLIRLPHFGDPDIAVDEQFYLLVGDRLLHGAVPFVDIWDRKPVGLFLLYAAIRLLGGSGILQYQVVAALFAGATAAVIALMARRQAGTFGGVAAGLAYLLWIETTEGGGGQSPIFYNLPVALAGLCVLDAVAASDRRRFRLLALTAMALGGLAIQVKYTALFETLYFGLVLAWSSLRRSARRVEALGETVALALTALAPTLSAILVYAAMGQLRPFWFANFTSIFLRGPVPPAELHDHLLQMILHVGPFLFCALASLWHLRGEGMVEARRWKWFMIGWMVAALIGFFSIGALFFHYMLPLFGPFAVAAAPIFRTSPFGKALAGLMIWLPFSHLNYPDFNRTRTSQFETARLAALIPADVDRGCLQVFSGPPILYLLTHACLASPYIFPDHLLARRETGDRGRSGRGASAGHGASPTSHRHPGRGARTERGQPSRPPDLALPRLPSRRSGHGGRLAL